MELTRQQILDFLGEYKFMVVATYGKFPWIASVYYTFDNNLNLYFLSSPTTLHSKQIEKNNRVSVSIADSHQEINKLKRGMQISGIAKRIPEVAKIKHALSLWKSSLGVKDPELTYENMMKKIVIGRMYLIKPLRIKLFDQKLFPVDDGEEPVLILG
ncbi:MAG TPA: pyridoxamine 5'-phosphate oxidase family protein [Patescibacteria group bacterium]|nr:pyridoxamine 5'-phosphate oxidase family protein [Patescibacteria group bacterium]